MTILLPGSVGTHAGWNKGEEACLEGKLLCARCRGWRISAGSKPGRKLEQGLVAAAGGGQLHSAVGAGDGHHRHSRQAEGRGVT